MKVIGIGGFARAGKDAFVSIAKNILVNNKYYPQRYAFADNLKNEVGDMLKGNNFKLDIYTTDTAEKAKVRPLLVWWGCARRDLSKEGMYWVEQVHKELEGVRDHFKNMGVSGDEFVALISDARFVNEVNWLHNEWGGQFIHLRRFSTNGEVKTFDAAPNEEEAKNDPLIQELADVRVEWESRGIPAGGCVTQDAYLQGKVLDALNRTKFFNGTLSV